MVAGITSVHFINDTFLNIIRFDLPAVNFIDDTYCNATSDLQYILQCNIWTWMQPKWSSSQIE